MHDSIDKKVFVNKCFLHCMNSIQIRSFFWSVFSRIWTEYWDLQSTGKYGLEKTPNLDTFYAVLTGIYVFYL